MTNRVAELTIESTTRGIEVTWTQLAIDLNETETQDEMRKWCRDLASKLEGEACTLKFDLHRVHSETGNPVPLGFGFERRNRESRNEVDRPVATLVAQALDMEWD